MKRRNLTPDELRLWQQVTRQDVPLSESARYVPPPSARPPGPIQPQDKRYEQYFTTPMPTVEVDPLPCGSYAGIDRNTATRFRKGQYPIDASLDLHGMTREQAHRALSLFIRNQHDRGGRCLLVVTGGGRKPLKDEGGSPERGILRRLLPQWLMEPGLKAMVLALDAAKPKHGGGGAYYILLRRRR